MESSSRFIGICCALLIGGALCLTMPIKTSHTSSYASLLQVVDPSIPDVSGMNSPLEPPRITAEAAVIYDPLQNEFLYQKNAQKPLGIASISKIMTAIVALERVGENDIVEIHASAIKTEGDEGALSDGEHFTLQNLIALMLATSSNDAAVAIAEHVGSLYGASSFEESQQMFVRFMNETAQKIGLENTHFKNPTGLDIDEEAGIVSNTSTAEETARLLGYALRYPTIYMMRQTPSILVSEEGREHPVSFTHALITNEAGVISGKTGFTDTAGGALATVTEIPVGKLSIVVVLNSTRTDRFDDTLRLLDWLRLPR
ncbi:MAG: hypothetical protein A3J54_00300 [Candidatus Ryanbacteria bacterium RIFCSPHIGHO2_02_FULL_45_13b]|uniref:Peptidase S11 D-alanyl-D-alanine carboxypeptidase A N-terminal domain-containing protein n=1 Tax=Candidatus Ryanbacteria bacterium RIFCSPHIGHO2_02_FULL_45_13b TaxID=1802117 RepID=A0A1G2G9L6_9BACT|nr:MAG: hypothetical protein A3J54_00300 [Candidatus Ryanbacteria bacterium RIFCSPHIGHO2_02_FULL_45_13b]